MKHDCVVIADTHHGVLESINKMLETMFCSVVMVSSKESLFNTARKQNPDLTIIDLSIRSSDGEFVIKEFCSSFPENKVLIMSVHDDHFIADNMIESGASGFILKRAAVTELVPAIQSIFNGNTYISPLIKSNSFKVENK